MIFNSLVLHNFGPYAGEHELPLSDVSRSKPVILIGGMNGTGKSSLMDAIQLALFGKLARCPGRREVSYDDFLRGCVHRGVRPQQARVQLEFTLVDGGAPSSLTLDRSWSCTDNTVREYFEVRRDGRIDLFLTENWLEHVEHWLPTSLAELFFFDGEQLEALADATTSAVVLRRAIEALLGLDLVGQLNADLLVLQRRHERNVLPPAARDELTRMESHLDSLEETKRRLHSELGAATNDVDACRMELAKLERALGLQGGDLFQRRHELEAEHAALERALAAAEDALRETSAGVAPLLLVRDLIGDVWKQVREEEESGRSALLLEALEGRDAALLQHLRGLPGGTTLLGAVTQHLQNDRDERRRHLTLSCVHALADDARESLKVLVQAELEAEKVEIKERLIRWNELQQQHEGSHRRLASIPSSDMLGRLLVSREERRVALQAAEARRSVLLAEQERVTREIARSDTEIVRFREAHRAVERTSDDAERAILHIGKVRGTLQRFRDALLQRHIRRIEDLALDSLQSLFRKDRLIQGLQIDPESFEVRLTGHQGEAIPASRLSAGERQLLATGLFWALRRAAHRVVPLVIDTPLGRLDSEHRSHLVTRYFPRASHQTILLSTDQEIVGPHYGQLKPFVAAEYTLALEESTQRTTIAKGYFSTLREVSYAN